MEQGIQPSYGKERANKYYPRKMGLPCSAGEGVLTGFRQKRENRSEPFFPARSCAENDFRRKEAEIGMESD
jgi:hypothetical protein